MEEENKEGLREGHGEMGDLLRALAHLLIWKSDQWQRGCAWILLQLRLTSTLTRPSLRAWAERSWSAFSIPLLHLFAQEYQIVLIYCLVSFLAV